MMFTEGLDDTAIQWIKQGSQVEDSKPEPDAPARSPLSERRIVSERFPRSPVLNSPVLPPLKFHTALLTPRNVAFSVGDDTDESTVSLPDDADSSDEELSAPTNLDYLERPVSHYYDEDELFGCKLPKPQRSNGILKKGLANQNLTLQLPNTLGVQKKLTPGAGGVHLHKQVHLRSLNCLDDSVEFATPPSAPPIIDADFPPQLERFSKGSPMNEQNESWPSRESVGGRSECSIEQKPSNVKATTDFAQRLDRTITENTERPHLAYYNTSSCNSQYAWQTLITYDACIRLCLQAWARGCTEAPEFLKDECLALRSAFGLHDFLLQPRGVKAKQTEGINARNSEQTFPLKMKKVVGKIRVEVRKLRIIPRRKLQITSSQRGSIYVQAGMEYVRHVSSFVKSGINSMKSASSSMGLEVRKGAELDLEGTSANPLCF